MNNSMDKNVNQVNWNFDKLRISVTPAAREILGDQWVLCVSSIVYQGNAAFRGTIVESELLEFSGVRMCIDVIVYQDQKLLIEKESERLTIRSFDETVTEIIKSRHIHDICANILKNEKDQE